MSAFKFVHTVSEVTVNGAVPAAIFNVNLENVGVLKI